MTRTLTRRRVSSWSPPVALSVDDIHVWRASLHRQESEEKQLAAILSSEEQHRIARSHESWHRAEAIAAHACLRMILAGYTCTAPEDIRLHVDAYGKPSLAPGCSASVTFNMAHCDGLAVYAIALDRQVGIDVERVREIPVDEMLSRTVWSPLERVGLLSMLPEQRVSAFYSAWVRKEACHKAIGVGLSRGIVMEVGIGQSIPQVEIVHALDGTIWSVALFDPGPGCLGAVAAEGCGWGVRLYDLTNDFDCA